MPAWNVAPWIGAAIRSVLGQTWPDWRLVIVDDGSVDATFAVAGGFADPRLLLVRQANAGVSAARNRGAEMLDGDALLFLDADDVLATDALAVLAPALAAAPGAVAAVGPYAHLDAALRLDRGGAEIAAPSARPGPVVQPVAGDLLERML